MMKRICAFALMLVVLLSALPIKELSAEAAMPYYITVDLTNQIVTIYSTADDSVVRQMLCSTAKRGYTTPEGDFTLPKNRRSMERKEWYIFYYYMDYAKWATRIDGSILFHSIPYLSMTDGDIDWEEAKKFGTPASHGCIRLLDADAYFIAKNCLAGTKVKIYRSNEPNAELRELLFEGSFVADNGISYEAFLGVPEDPDTLGRFSTGQKVEDLQYRLRALGFYSGDVTGSYNTDTITAVRELQASIGYNQNGQVSPQLYSLIFSSDAPTGTNVALSEGMSGPVVRNLQNHLKELCLYDGDVDGVYDIDVITAVQQFQQTYGYSIDAHASPEVQQALAYEAGKLAETFGEADYTCSITTQSLNMAIVTTDSKVRIRSQASTESEPLDKLSDGTTVRILESDDTWSKIQYENTIGYMMNSFLRPADMNMLVLEYTGGGKSYTIGATMDDYQSGANLPSVAFAAYLASPAAQIPEKITHEYATVNTGDNAVLLNLRASADSSADVIAMLENGSKHKVVEKDDVWTKVEFEGSEGYLMTDYVEFHLETSEVKIEEEPEEEIPDDAEALDEMLKITIYATVKAADGSADVFDVDSADASRLGELPNGTQVTVLSMDDNWVHIELMGRQGYMHDSDLEIDMGDALL